MSYDVERVRADFPILSRRLDGDQPLVYLDSANTSHKPQVVLDALDDFYRLHNSNVGRAVHQLGAAATDAYEAARAEVASFVGAPDPAEIVFTKNATEALNLVASVLAWAGDELRVGAGD
ncbi:MAG: aminotransferase class V-fold PLP-dependent enzyme, partial [Actinomycetota bacterium]|nr:aminotransferase class V-fold PLP-dependent enzyme [Actinomycetota bacterium]